ncbi:DUF4157 domain-containing protein [Leptothrix ochracea]|uniref:eCIS core domain-containing protein n=1 Tax=Leptothrix ochracea TaxID=735331 RepID=UPI0034E1C408
MSKISTPQEPSRLPSQTLQALQAVQSNVGQAYKGTSVEAPQSEQFTQLAAMADSSPSLVTQRKLTGMQSNAAAAPGAPPAAHHTGLPTQLKAGIESLSGISMDHVQVHYNSSKPAQLQALAYAQGSNIHVGPGQEKHLPHEAWHVVQQAQGRVRPTLQAKGMPINDDPSLEREADVMGARAASISLTAKASAPSLAQGQTATGFVQRKSTSLFLAADLLDQEKTSTSGNSKFKDIYDKVNEYNNIPITDLNYANQLEKITNIHDAAVKWFNKNIKTNKPQKRKAMLDLSMSATLEMVNIELILKGLEFGKTASDLRSAIAKKIPDGPLMTKEQGDYLINLSKDTWGTERLQSAKIYNFIDAKSYLMARNFRNWLTISPANRVWMAYIAWREFGSDAIFQGTPAFNLGRSMDGKDKKLSAGEREEAQKGIDSDLRESWHETLVQPDESKLEPGITKDQISNIKHSQKILKKILIILHAGLEINDDKGDYTKYEGSVVRALSHGGRVNIRIPAITDNNPDPHELFNWIGFGKEGENGLVHRSYGTHNLDIGDNHGNQKGSLKEKGGSWAAIRSKLGSTRQHGMDLAVGGLGKKDFNGDIILPDGSHGHMLIFYLAPTMVCDGGLMIGIETTAPGADSTVGYVHNMFSNEATANPESSFGGMKSDKISKHRLVDLNNMNEGRWLEKLNLIEGDIDKITNENQRIEALIGPRMG